MLWLTMKNQHNKIILIEQVLSARCDTGMLHGEEVYGVVINDKYWVYAVQDRVKDTDPLSPQSFLTDTIVPKMASNGQDEIAPTGRYEKSILRYLGRQENIE